MLLTLLLACTPTFDETRKDLASFRLLGMSVADGAPRAAVWSGLGAWHEVAPTLDWTVNAEAPPLTADLLVTDAEGHEERGTLAVEADARVPTVRSVSRSVDGAVAVLSLDVDGEAEGAYTRWSANGGATIVEDGPNAATVSFPEAGWYTVFALVLDGKGGTTWEWIDVAVDVPEPSFAAGGRLLPTDGSGTPDTAGDWLATLRAEDGTVGWRLTELEPLADGQTGEEACGLMVFELSALADGRCGRADADGKRVHVQGTPLP